MMMKPKFNHLVLACFTSFAACAASSAIAADLTVEVKGSGDKGNVMAALYKTTDKWMGASTSGTMVRARAGAVSVTFKDLEIGDYAVSVFVDENGNGKLDTNAIGIPTEPFAFSNDASGTFGPPSFAQAKFSVGKENKNIVINVK